MGRTKLKQRKKAGRKHRRDSDPLADVAETIRTADGIVALNPRTGERVALHGKVMVVDPSDPDWTVDCYDEFCELVFSIKGRESCHENLKELQQTTERIIENLKTITSIWEQLPALDQLEDLGKAAGSIAAEMEKIVESAEDLPSADDFNDLAIRVGGIAADLERIEAAE